MRKKKTRKTSYRYAKKPGGPLKSGKKPLVKRRMAADTEGKDYQGASSPERGAHDLLAYGEKAQ